MRKKLLLGLCALFMLNITFAQTTATGKVVDEKGAAISGATVLEKGTKNGTTTASDGSYSLKVKTGAKLVVSSVGYEDYTVAAGGNSSISLKTITTSIDELTVTTAYGIKRTARSTSSNIQVVGGEQLNTVRQPNINNALAGKVAGIQVRSQSSAAIGRETSVRLRGENGLGLGGGALYVVDGTIMPDASDINPDDIADLSVLQGPAATALLGPQGTNGAILITTKKARKGSAPIIELNSGVTFDKVARTMNYQNSYAGGGVSDLIKYNWKTGDPTEWKALDGNYYHDYTDDASWGPRMMGQTYIPWYAWLGGHAKSYKTASLTPQPDNVKDFFNTGVTITNNVNFSKANENSSFRFSYTNLDVKGIIPNSYLKKHTLNTNFSFDVTPKFNISSNLFFLSQKANSETDDGYSNNSTGSFNQWFHRDLDMKELKNLRGLKTKAGYYSTWNLSSNPSDYDAAHPENFYKSNYWINPFSYFDLVSNTFSKTRFTTDLALTYKFTNWLKVKGTYRRQQATGTSEDIYPTELEITSNQLSFNPYNETTAEGTLAAYHTGNFSDIKQNFEGLATIEHKFKDYSLSLNSGFDFYKSNRQTFDANTSGGLVIPGVYSLANSVNPIRNVTTGGRDNNNQLVRNVNFSRRALFTTATIGYKNYAFIDGTYRVDYLSPEPAGKAINTYSIGTSLILTDMFKLKSSTLSFAKIRASHGKIVNALNPYDLDVYYSIANTINGNAIISEPNTLINPSLSGATNTENELGLELRFLNNRFGLTATTWSRTNKDFPVSITVSGTSGYGTYRTNAGELSKKGLDLTAFAEVLQSKNINWRITAAWSKLTKNNIESIDKEGQVKSLISGGGSFSPATGASTRAAWMVSAVGQRWGVLTGNGLKRINGNPVLTSTGLFVPEANVNYGSALPDYTGGIQNEFTIYKRFKLNVNIDYSVGGKFYSLSDFWGSFSGLTAKTAALNDKGNNVRDAVADGGGVRVNGVDATGKLVNYYVDAQTYFHQFNNANISEMSVYDLDFVKCREISLAYTLPNSIFASKNSVVKGASVSFILRNAFLIYSKTKDFDPSEISGTYGEDGQYPATRSMGFNIKLNF